MRTLITALLAALLLAAQQPAFTPPEDLDHRRSTIISEGTRMTAYAYAPRSAPGRKLPCILMAHGWGGTQASLRSDAVVMARAGYLVVTFDYRGWGESEARVILTQPAPAQRPGGKFTAEVQEVREVVDPLDFGADWLNAIHWIVAEPQCDSARLGLWGSSFSGGLVVWAAARDPRVKALHSQVGAMGGRNLLDAGQQTLIYEESTKRARGELGYPPPGAKVIGNLRGAPIRSRFVGYAPGDEVAQASHCAMQFVIAEKEELFDNRDHAIRAHELARGPKRLINIPNITHYGIYTQARQQAQKLAIEWFDQHLKGPGR